MNQDLLDFLAKMPLCTVASINAAGAPQAALVGFSHTDDLKLYFGTSKLTRKYKNLIENPKIAVVIAEFTAEVQYEGTALEVTEESHKKAVMDRHFKKVPGSQKFLNDENQTYFEITPTWLRFIQHGRTDKVIEMTEF